MALSIPEQLAQLDAARQIVLSDPALYPQIVNGVLPIINAGARPELKRWGANFLAETFGSPVIDAKTKQQMAIQALPVLNDLIEIPSDDATFTKGVLEASASIYEPIFKHIIENPHNAAIWANMAAIKSNILKRWDKASGGVKICCIKFAQRVIHVQTPGPIADPRRPMQSETSVTLVSRDHPLIPPSKLEPEASGLLDRLLDVFNQEPYDAIAVDATLNSLGLLLRSRQSIVNKVMNAVLNFNPFKLANGPVTPKQKVFIKSMERTARSLLMNVYRRAENSPFAPRIKQYVERMNQNHVDVLAEYVSKKRGLPSEPTDGLDQNKRRRLGAGAPEEQGHKLTIGGPKTLGNLFTLTNDAMLASFDVQQLPQGLVANITQGLLTHIAEDGLQQAINSVRARLLYLTKASQANALGDDEEDYEPDYDEPKEDREQILNRADAMPLDDPRQQEQELALGPFELAQPPALSATDAQEAGVGVISRVFGLLGELEGSSAAAKAQKPGLDRLAGNSNDKEAWLTFIIRLASRAPAGLYGGVDRDSNSKDETEQALTQQSPPKIADTLRENLWRYVVEDFRARIFTAIAWLNEEWFNDKVQRQDYEAQQRQAQSTQEAKAETNPPTEHYEHWVLRVLDAIMPYLDAKDKVLIRFLSEIPLVSKAVLERVKSLARDPERVDLAVRSLHYIILMKPPAREDAIDAVEDLWRNYEDARASAAKLLRKWRPGVLPPAAPPETSAGTGGDGLAEAAPSASANPVAAAG